MSEHKRFDPTLLSQTCKCAPMCDDRGDIVAYQFKTSKTRRKAAGNLNAAIEPDEYSFSDCICPGKYGHEFLLIDKYSEWTDLNTLFREIGFAWNALENTMQVPTISKAQENLDRLAIPIQLVPTRGIASDAEFLSVFARNDERVVSLAVSTGQEFLHDMTIHVCNIVRYLCAHELDDSTGTPTDFYGKEEERATHGSYFAALMHGKQEFRKAAALIDSLHSVRQKSVLLTYLASLCDLYTASDTSQRNIKVQLHCLMTGEHSNNKACTCVHSTGVNCRPYFNAAYYQDNFAALLVDGAALLRQKYKATL